MYSDEAFHKRVPMGTPNREPQEYSRNTIEYKDPSKYIPVVFQLYSWGSLFGVPSKVPLFHANQSCDVANDECESR